MKLVYFFISIVIVGILAFYLVRRKSNQHSKHESIKSPGKLEFRDNPFLDLRNQALNVTPELLQLQVPYEETIVFGVIMDWDMGNGIATLVSFQTGDASMYLSSGGGSIGGISHLNVVNESKLFVSKAQNFLGQTNRIDSTPLPNKHCIRFYFLTNKGKFYVEEHLQNIENGTSLWLPLFEQGNNVISELRKIEEGN
jgi:hypothetical protein